MGGGGSARGRSRDIEGFRGQNQKTGNTARRSRNQKTRPLHHGGTEEQRKTKDKWVLFGPPAPGGFIQGRVSIFRTCLSSRKMRARKNKGGGLDLRAKIAASSEDFQD